MQLAFVQCLETGIHMLILLDLVGLALGAGVQFLICRKVKSGVYRWLFILFDLLAMLVCDVFAQCITGWNLLVPLFAYWFFLMLLLGAVLCILAIRFLGKK